MNRKVVLVTGSSIGLGKSIIEKYASNNYDVVIHYLNHENEAKEIQKSLEEKYGVKSPALTSKVRKLRPDIIDLDVDSIMAIRRYVKAGYTEQQISALTCLPMHTVKKYSKTIFV